MVTANEYYQYVRKQIEHEDALINNRMTWLIGLQAFLFGAYGFSLGAEVGPNVTPSALVTIATARTGFALIGIISSVVVLIALYAASRSIGKLVDKWTEQFSASEQLKFPQIIGNLDSRIIFRGGQSSIWKGRVRNRVLGLMLGLVPVFALPIACISVWFYIEGSRGLVTGLFFAILAMVICSVILLVGVYIGRRLRRVR